MPIFYCNCETPVFDWEHDAGCRRCGLPINFNPPEDDDSWREHFEVMGEEQPVGSDA